MSTNKRKNTKRKKAIVKQTVNNKLYLLKNEINK